ncbi:unnamed protein product [Phaeothamnion confervicola]
MYSMLIYTGPGRLAQLKCELAALLERDGFTSLSEAVGAAHRGGGPATAAAAAADSGSSESSDGGSGQPTGPKR